MKTQTQQHTPTPWKVMHNEIGLEWNIEAGNELIAVLVPKNQRNLDNAAFIVRAVNSHEALLAALKRYMSFNGRYGEFGNYEEMDSTDIAVNLSILRKQANEAIAQAEGKE